MTTSSAALRVPASTELLPPSLLQLAKALTQGELDALPSSVLELDRVGRICRLNRRAGELLGLAPAQGVRRFFFVEVAPCTQGEEFYGRFLRGVTQRSLCESFSFCFLLAGTPRQMRVILCYSPASDTTWVLLNPVEVPGL